MTKLSALKGFFVLAVVIVLSLYSASCDQFPTLSSKKSTSPTQQPSAPLEIQGVVVAKVNNYPVFLEDFNQEIENYNALVPEEQPDAKITTREQKLEYLKNQMTRRVLLYQEAARRGLDKKSEIQRIIEKTKADLMVVELVKEIADSVEVTYDEINSYYEQFKEELKSPEERHIREIAVGTEAEARDVMIQLYQGADFATLARERSKAASSGSGGDLDFITLANAEAKFPRFGEEAFAKTLELGKISNYFQGPDGFYVIKLEEKRGGQQRALSDIWDDIKNYLTFIKQEQTIQTLIDNLQGKAKTEYREGEIE
ncbi:peptidyl-prolyl cis-trans isomerase [Candidatus Omnitrophota bacterium]